MGCPWLTAAPVGLDGSGDTPTHKIARTRWVRWHTYTQDSKDYTINCGRKMAKWLKLYATYTFSTSSNLCHRTTLLNTDVPNCYITLEFITIILRVRHPSVERPPYSEEGTTAQESKEDQCQELTAANKHARKTRARQLLNKYLNLTANFIFFLLTKSYSSLLPRPTYRTIVFTSVRVPERRTSTKTNSFERVRHSATQSVDARQMDAGLTE